MKDERPIAIITDGLWRKSISAIRALGQSGHRVFVLGDSILTPGFYSRYTSRTFKGATAATDPCQFGDVLRRAFAATEGRPTVLLPMEDATCEWLLEHAPTIPPNIKWLLPEPQNFAICRDKGLTMELAQRLEVPCPQTQTPDSIADLRKQITAYPKKNFVIKPRTGSGSSGIIYAPPVDQTSLDAHWNKYGPLLIQERIPPEGTACGVSLLYDAQGQLRAAFSYRRLRQYPVGGGPSTQRISIPHNELLAHSRKLLEALKWRGVAMVEWKIDPTNGRPMLLEINPRFWGSLALAVKSGIDFPTLYATAARNEFLPEELPSYPPGIINRWMIPGDILRYLSEPKASRESFPSFLSGMIRDSEEYESRDLRGSVACCICPLLLATKPKYWRYVRRRNG